MKISLILCLEEEWGEEEEGVERDAWLEQGSALRLIELQTAPSELVPAQLRNASEETG